LLDTTLVLEIGCNHKGELSIAKDMIEKISEIDSPFKTVIKFQKRCPRELLSKEAYSTPHPNSINSYGATYGEHREFLELDINAHKELKELIESKGMEYSTSVWDMTSCKEVISLNPSMIKIPSAINTNFKMLEYLCTNFKGKIHISLGMTTPEEEFSIINLFREHNRQQDLVFYACTSGYPIKDSEVYANEIKGLKDTYDDIAGVGYSSHLEGIKWDTVLVSLGINFLERHFTLNKNWKGTDHSASIDLEDYRTLVSDLITLNSILKNKPSSITGDELIQRNKLKYRG
jgi:N-acetylneuraminate synthase